MYLKFNAKNIKVLVRFICIAALLLSIIRINAPTSNVSAAGSTTISLDSGITYQTIDGFGTCVEQQCDVDPLNLFKMNPTQRTQIIDRLFDQSTGAGMTILRLEAGMGYYYSLSRPDFTIEPNSPGNPNNTPTYQWDGSADHLVWVAQQAVNRGVNSIYLNAWSAPAFMKINGDWSGNSRLDMNWSTAYANYLVKYIQSYASSGVNITHIGPFNETDCASSYQGMTNSASDVRDVIKILGARLAANGLSTKIVSPESGSYSFASSCLDTIFADPVAAGYLAVASAHAYGGNVAQIPSATAAGKHTWMSEYAPISTNPWNPNYTGTEGGQELAGSIMYSLTHGVSAYIDWSPTEPNNGLQNQHLFKLYDSSTFDTSKRLWVYANFSRYIRPGAVRIDAYCPDSNIQVFAAKNTDNSYVIVANNYNTSDSILTINNVSGGTLYPYVTNDSSAMAAQSAVGIGSGTVSVTIPANSTVTYRMIGTTVSGGTPGGLQIQCENYNSINGITNYGTCIGDCDNGDWVCYNNVDLGSGYSTFTANVACDNGFAGGHTEVRLDSTTGTLLGTLTIAGTGGWNNFQQQSIPVTNASGIHNIYLKFTSNSTGNFDWINFSGTGGVTPTPTPTPTPGGGIVSGATYKIIARHSGKLASIDGANPMTDGDNIHQWFDIGSNNMQKWVVTDMGGGYYKIACVYSGKSMSIDGSNPYAEGDNVHQWSDINSDMQRWQIIDVGGGYYKVINKYSGKALNVSGGGTGDGANIDQWTYIGNNNQHWQFVIQ